MTQVTQVETPSAALIRMVAPLEPSKGARLREILTPVFIAVDDWKAEASMLRVTDETQVGKMKRSGGLRLEIKKKRVAVVKRLEELKADAIAEQRIINDVIRLYTDLLETMETDLKESETFGKRAAAAREEAIRASRTEELLQLGVSKVALPAALGTMTEQAWSVVRDDAILTRAAKELREVAARQERDRLEAEAQREREAEEMVRLAEEMMGQDFENAKIEDRMRDADRNAVAFRPPEREPFAGVPALLRRLEGRLEENWVTVAERAEPHAPILPPETQLMDVLHKIEDLLGGPATLQEIARPQVIYRPDPPQAFTASKSAILAHCNWWLAPPQVIYRPDPPQAFTASKSAILAHCNWWLAPGARWDNASHAGAELGVEKHGLASAEIDGSDFEASDRAHEAFEAMRPLLAELASRGDAFAEVAFAYDPVTDTARILSEGKSREEAYSLAAPHEVTGTADLMVVGRGVHQGTVFIDDHKSWAPGVHVDAKDQLRTLGMFAARALNLENVEIGTVLMGDFEARRVDVEVLDYFAIEKIAGELTDRLQAPIVPPNPGAWCRWCPHRTFCSVAEQAIDQVVDDAIADTLPASALVRDRKLTLDIQDAAQLEFTIHALMLVDQRRKAIWREACRFADREGGVTLSDGRVFSGKEVTVERPLLDVPGAVNEIQLAGAGEAIVPHATWAAITQAIGKTQALALRETLRAIGAVDAKTSPRYRIRKADEEPSDE
jgi:hypothetical protein